MSALDACAALISFFLFNYSFIVDSKNRLNQVCTCDSGAKKFTPIQKYSLISGKEKSILLELLS